MAFTTTSSVAARLTESPFVLDTGATCHISPKHSDFCMLTPIPPHPIKGLRGKCVYAVGLGTIKLSVGPGKHVVLYQVLFALASAVHLISVLTLNKDGNCISHFNSTICWIIDKATGNIIAEGTVSVMAWLPQLGIRTYIFSTRLPVLLSQSSDLISSPLPIVVARYFFTLLAPSLSFLPLLLPSGIFCSRSLYVPLPSGSFCTLPTCSN
jgi:hypothetical protein